MSKPPKGALSNVLLGPSRFRLIPWRLLKGNRVGVWIRFNDPDRVGFYEAIHDSFREEVEDKLKHGIRDLLVEWLPRTDKMEGTIQLQPPAAEAASIEGLYAWMTDALETARDVLQEVTANLEDKGARER